MSWWLWLWMKQLMLLQSIWLWRHVWLVNPLLNLGHIHTNLNIWCILHIFSTRILILFPENPTKTHDSFKFWGLKNNRPSHYRAVNFRFFRYDLILFDFSTGMHLTGKWKMMTKQGSGHSSLNFLSLRVCYSRQCRTWGEIVGTDWHVEFPVKGNVWRQIGWWREPDTVCGAFKCSDTPNKKHGPFISAVLSVFSYADVTRW